MIRVGLVACKFVLRIGVDSVRRNILSRHLMHDLDECTPDDFSFHAFVRRQSQAPLARAGHGSVEDICSSKKNDVVEAKPLEEDDCCPICQEEMNRSESLTFCQRGCGNHIHVKCMEGTQPSGFFNLFLHLSFLNGVGFHLTAHSVTFLGSLAHLSH